MVCVCYINDLCALFVFLTLLTCAFCFVFVTCALCFVFFMTSAFCFVFVTLIFCVLWFVIGTLMTCVLFFCIFYINDLLRTLLCYVDGVRALFGFVTMADKGG